MPVRAFGSECRDALWEIVDAAQAADPLAPVTVLPPSAYAGLSLRRSFAGRSGRRGLANVRFLPMARLAELLGAPRLAAAGRRPLTAPLRAAAIRRVLAADPGVLAGAADHPATERALEATLVDLRRAGGATASALARRGVLGASLARQLSRFREHTSAFYDDEDLAIAAATAVRDRAPTLREVGLVVLYLPDRMTPGQLDLVDALQAVGGVQTVLGVTGDVAADATTLELGHRLGVSIPSVAAVAPSGTELLNAPDPEDEVRAVRRQLLERTASGVPLHRLAVLYRIDEPYARLVHQLLDSAGVAWAGPSVRRLAETTTGRVLLGLLRLPDDGFRRSDVAAWLASGPIRDPDDGHPVDAHRWDLISRRAGIVTGLDQWATRLAQFGDQLAQEPDADVSDATRAYRNREHAHTERLAAFVADLGVRVTLDAPTWAEAVDRVGALLDAYLGPEHGHGSWPESEVEASRRVRGLLDGLRALDQLDQSPGPIDGARLRRALEVELDAPAGRVGRSGHGVFVGPLRHALGCEFDTVWVLGMAEGEFPPRGREDPLLPDRERQALGPDLGLHAARRGDERRQYLAALASAERRVLTFPRADPRAQRKRLPARWLIETAEARAGHELSAEGLLEHPPTPWYSVVRSFQDGVVHAAPPGSLTERDLADLGAWRLGGHRIADHPLVTVIPELARGAEATTSRLAPGFTRFDGAVSARSDLVPAHAVSPTSLESWATCPFQYFLGHVLRIGTVERPEETETISTLDRGTLVHGVLEEFLRTAAPRVTPDQTWSPDEQALLARIAVRHADEAEAAGLTGRPLLWKLARRQIMREVLGFLERDEQLRREHGVLASAAGVELAFGLPGAATPAVPVDLAGATVEFRGRIDRIDQSADGSKVVVYDYKTGRSTSSPELAAALGRGTKLQLAIYALAARRMAPDASVEAYYWYLRNGEVSGYPLDAEHEAVFGAVAGEIVQGVEHGVFPAYPGEPRVDRHSWDNCLYCPFDQVCPPGRAQTWERMRDDSQVVGFRRLAEPDEDSV